MLNFAMIKPLGGILKRLDTQAILNEIKSIDIKAPDAAEKAGMAVVGMILPKIEDVADDLVRLVAAYKGKTFDEALTMDPIITLKELFAEQGFVDFFKSAAQRAGLK